MCMQVIPAQRCQLDFFFNISLCKLQQCKDYMMTHSCCEEGQHLHIGKASTLPIISREHQNKLSQQHIMPVRSQAALKHMGGQTAATGRAVDHLFLKHACFVTACLMCKLFFLNHHGIYTFVVCTYRAHLHIFHYTLLISGGKQPWVRTMRAD